MAMTHLFVSYADSMSCKGEQEAEHQDAPPKVQSGTTTIIYPLRNTTMRDVELQPTLENRAKCNLITFVKDVCPTRSQMCDMSEHMVLDIIKILIDNHPGFEYLTSSPAFKHHSY
ncbi:uncharacterized protein EDB91DRAFT_1088476 [Suillus paluster]|uniref:uncharacterized protein n=1 Tax=Suillus paluster TaxID=48578 RepID=UPI001B8807AB|nr:uncharacterized protein EDB91DRAFT_1088476 [Suillus paluster]KAG1721370.1 hypothetical protein EDB91DRAFT_1088476 [Suillus paluster]